MSWWGVLWTGASVLWAGARVMLNGASVLWAGASVLCSVPVCTGVYWSHCSVCLPVFPA